MTDSRLSTGGAGPIAWMVQRECDPTFPRLFMSHAKATELLNYCNVGPLPTIHPLYLDVAQAAPEPVAYRWRYDGERSWTMTKNPPPCIGDKDLTCEAMYTAPLDPAYPPAEPFIKEVERLRAGIQSIVDCVNPLTRAAVREACAEILAGTPSLPSTDREGT